MNIILNGEPISFNREELNLHELILQSEIKNMDRVVVQLNGKMIRKAVLESTLVTEGDKVNILHLVGGGSI